jgi:hypothetical protein
MKWNLDETPSFNGEFHSIVSLVFNFMTHRELVIVPGEFYLDETHFFSLLKFAVMSSKMSTWQPI